MNIFCLVKQVPDTNLQLKVTADKLDIVREGVNYCVSPYDEFAIEEALRIRDAHSPSTVTALALGPERADEVLRTALAMGANDAVHLLDSSDLVKDPLTTARCIGQYLKSVSVDLVLCGRQAIDGDAFQVPALLARVAGYGEIALASKVVVQGGKEVRVERVLEGGTRQTVSGTLPCVISCQKGLNEPRYANLPGIMKARKREIKKVPVASLGVDLAPRITIRNLHVPKYERKLKVIEKPAREAALELIALLYKEAKVL